MTRDEITRMAREAGFETGVVTDAIYAPASCRSELERFAALVAAAEREACAKLVEAQDVDPAFKQRIAWSIRARSNNG